MDDQHRERLFELADAWNHAEQAYDTESAKYVSTGWASEELALPAEEPLTQDGLDELEKLLDQMKDARRSYLECAATLMS